MVIPSKYEYDTYVIINNNNKYNNILFPKHEATSVEQYFPYSKFFVGLGLFLTYGPHWWEPVIAIYKSR